MNVYDFDKTIYPGDSTMHFFLYCVVEYPRILSGVPSASFFYLRYLIKNISKTRCKEHFFRFLERIPDPEGQAKKFWAERGSLIYPWYLNQSEKTDVIISASPEFLLKPICETLQIERLIASQVHPKTGKYTGKNCYGKEKVIRFQSIYNKTPIDRFYSDSFSDRPLALLAREAYLVKNGIPDLWPEHDLQTHQ